MTRQIEAGTVIAGTLRDEDLRASLTAEICYVSAGEADSESLGLCNHPYGAECLCDDISTLIDALNEYAPEGMYFGTLEGDGADFGWWYIEGSVAHTVALEVEYTEGGRA